MLRLEATADGVSGDATLQPVFQRLLVLQCAFDAPPLLRRVGVVLTDVATAWQVGAAMLE